MTEQNIFDNPIFFEGYQRLRANKASANLLVEKPALFSLCPDFRGKRVLDLGCGYGENCRAIGAQGAEQVLGIDISEKMLQVAQGEPYPDNVRFLQMSMNRLEALTESFDVILSSLALHYIEDFDRLLQNVFALLSPGGVFVFSQEHPLTTAPKKGPGWSRDGEGTILHYNLTDYGDEGERQTTWFVDGVKKYHRPFSAILNGLISAGFLLEKVLEPIPEEWVTAEYPAYQKDHHKPDFLLIRAKKPAKNPG